MKALNANSKVLIVDDSELSRLILKLMFEKLGFEVELADGAEMAIASARRETFEIIVLDFMMPNVDGITTARLLNKHLAFTKHKSILIAATADRSDETKMKFAEVHPSAFLEKPITLPQLEATLHDLKCVA
jgi:CheY-like chemotaxis protein